MAKKKISIGIICFNEEDNIIPCYEALSKIAKKENKYNFEFIFSDNGSSDKTREKIKKIVLKDKRVIGVFLSRNFGPESNSQATLDHASGNAFILYEGDMQDPPKYIPNLLRKWEKGYDVVVGVRTKIEDSWFMTTIRKLYYKVFKAMSEIDVPAHAGSFGLLDKKVMEAIKNMPEKYRFYRGLRAWVGFKTTSITYHRQKRKQGKSSYNFYQYITHAERSFFGFSYLPLNVIVYLGFFIVFLSLICFAFYFILIIFFKKPINEYAVLLFSIFIFGGVQLLALSMIGKYIQVIVEETKKRPVYIIKKVIKNKSRK